MKKVNTQFEREYLGEWVKPDIETKERRCGCILALREDINLWECVSYCTSHLHLPHMKINMEINHDL